METFEKLGLFYLGKQVNPGDGELSEDYLLYESKDLTTHAVCVGMTGSGKTGLCVTLLEEAAIDGIPAIIIDPKGDLGNLLLTFPDLQPQDFQPWVNPDSARQKDMSVADFAKDQAELWRKGLAGWGQDGERIRRLRDSTTISIFTPGSSAGLPVSILSSFSAPDPATREDMDLFRERVQTTTSGLLSLLGIDADPLQSREHILVSNILEQTWYAGKNLDLGGLIQMIQAPPMTRIGVFDLESFYPGPERFKLAMALNNLLAAPGFQTWMEGASLDISELLYDDKGRPRTAIFSIAHLSDAERMFFVTLLLNQVLGWMRGQSGTTSLRALLYMDEVFGYLPPIGEPPSKRPLLTLLKQARAFGLGVVLATQNPVDLDYKGLSNTGTWFIGRLQTERDKDRLADGLSGIGVDRQHLMELISNLKKRQFILQNVHEKAPALFQTRWAMSYLAGPLTRDHIKTLMEGRKNAAPSTSATAAPSVPAPGVAAPAAPSPAASSGERPALIAEITQYVAPCGEDGEGVVYHPFLLAGAEVPIFSSKDRVSTQQTVQHLLPLSEEMSNFSWSEAREVKLPPAWLGASVASGASFAAFPNSLNRVNVMDKLDKQYEGHVYQTYQLTLLKCERLKQTAMAGESERDFRIRLQQMAKDRRDLETERLKRKYASKIDTLERQIKTAERQIDKEAAQYSQKKMDSMVSFGGAVLGAIFGGRGTSKFSTAARSVSRIGKEKQDVARAEAKFQELQESLAELERQMSADIDQITLSWDMQQEPLESVALRPKKADILQRLFGVLWVPFSGGRCLLEGWE